MHGQAHRGDIAYTYLILYVHICTVLVEIFNYVEVAIITGFHERCPSILYVKQKEVRGCTARHTGET